MRIYCFIVIVLVFFCSCSESATKSLSMIPDDANLVYKVNLGSLLQKVDVKELYRSDVLKAPIKRARSTNRKVYRVVSNAIEQPELLGIDLESSIFIYYLEELEDEKYFCVAVDLNNTDNFEAFLNQVLDKLDIEVAIEEAVDYKYCLVDEALGVGWDKDKALFIFPDNYASREHLDFELENLMTLNERYSMKNNDVLHDFCHSDKDISLMMNTNLLENNFRFQRLEELYNFDLDDNILIANLEFTNEHVLLDSRFVFNDDIKSFIEEYSVLENKMNEAMFKYIPKESFFLTSISLNPTGYYELLMDEDDFDNISASFKREFDVNLKDIFNMTTGNMVFTLDDFDEVERSYYRGYGDYGVRQEVVPMYSLVVELKNPELLKDVINTNVSNNKLVKRKKYYEINDGTSTEYLAFNEKYVLFTSSKKNIRSFIKDGYTTNLQSSDLKEQVINNNIYMFLDLDYDNYPSDVKKQLRKNQGRRDRVIFKTFTKLLRYASMEQGKDNNMSIKIGLKDFTLNDLEPLFDLNN